MKYILNRYLVLIPLIVFAVGCASTSISATAKDKSRNVDPETLQKIKSAASDENASDLQGHPVQLSRTIMFLIDGVPEEPTQRESSAETRKDDTGDADETADIEAQTGDSEGDAQNWLDEALGDNEESQKLWGEGDIDNSVKALDRAYGYILKVDTENNPDLSQQVDDLRYVISKRILEIYASRYTSVQGNHRAIPLDMNSHVEREIRLLQEEKRVFFLEAYQKSGRYRDEIVNRLKEAGLPEELSWLPLIESGFDVRALSSARALGLWQFIPSTGYKFGLRRDSWIDERLDPIKSTDAAIDYLRELHQIFGDWTTVLAAYNCGAGRVLKVIREQKINYLDNFWDLYEKLPRETARYVPRFLAVLQIMNDPAKYGFDFKESDDPPLTEVVTIQKQVSLRAAAEKIGVSSNELSDLNPELRYAATPPSPYDLRVPHGTGPALLSKVDEMPVWTPRKDDYAYYRVKKGDTMSSIARKYRTSVKEISRLNNIHRRNLIHVGQRLKVPVQGSVRTASPESGSGISSSGTYRVSRGDSLSLIAQRFKTNVESLQQLNGLSSSRLDIGQILKVKH